MLNPAARRALSAAILLAALTLPTPAQETVVSDLGLLPGDAAPGPAYNSQQDLAIARGGDQTLIVWSDYRGQSVGDGASQSDGDIFGIRLDAAGNPIDPVPFVINAAMGLQRSPKVAWNGQNWLVMFTSQDPAGGYFEDRLRAVRIAPTGQVLDATPLILPTSVLGLNIAGQAGQWLITYELYHADSYGTFLAGQRIADDGSFLDPAPLMLMDWIYGATTVLAADGEYLVAGPTWSSSSNFQARRIATTGLPLSAPFTVPSLNIAAGPTEYYTTWIADYINLVGSRMTRAGALLNPAGTILFSDPGLQYYSSTVTHDGLNWWFGWVGGSLARIMRISPAGTVLDPGGIQLPITVGGTVDQIYGFQMTGRPGGGVLVNWWDFRPTLGYDSNVFTMPVSASATPGPERCTSTGTTTQLMPDLAAGPDGRSALAFISKLAGESRILIHRLDAAGSPLAAEPIEAARAGTIGKVGIAWNGSIYMVVWDQGAAGSSPVSIKARRMTSDGSFLDASPIDVMPGHAPDVEALGDDFLIATARFATYPQFIDTWIRRIDGPTGAFLDPAPVFMFGGYVSAVRVRADGARWIVLFQSNWSHDDSRSDVLYSLVSPDGAFTPPVNPSTSSGVGNSPDVAFSGGKYLLVWRTYSLAHADNLISGRIMNPDRTFATGVFTIAQAPGRQLRPVVAWDGESFITAWDDQRNQLAFFDQRTDIYAARITEDGTVLDPSAFPIVDSPDGDATAAILSNGPATFIASARFSLTPPFDSYRIGLSRIGAPACPADLNGDGLVDFADYLEFLNLYDALDPRVDFNHDGLVDFADYLEFLNLFDQGC